MAVEYPYTTAILITKLAGQLAVDLRLDDSADADDDLEFAIDTGTVDVDFYLQQYSQADAADNIWVQQHATWMALRALCQRRLNDVPESILKECERREKQLMLVLQRKAPAPRLAKTRRPGVVSNYTTDLRRYNNQGRVDGPRSTGLAEGYQRPTDPTAPDDR